MSDEEKLLSSTLRPNIEVKTVTVLGPTENADGRRQLLYDYRNDKVVTKLWVLNTGNPIPPDVSPVPEGYNPDVKIALDGRFEGPMLAVHNVEGVTNTDHNYAHAYTVQPHPVRIVLALRFQE